MKKWFASLAAVGFLAAAPALTFAADGTINFTGKITDQACEIDAPNHKIDVELGTYSVGQFNGVVGTKTPPIPFVIKLKNCPVVEEGENPHFSIYLTGDSDAVNKDYLKVTGGAAGVAIVIHDDQGNIVPMNNFTTRKFEVPSANVDLNLIAYYESTATTITPGVANGTTDITFDYR
ncbi:fimbrial protein [Franconibacter helveticus]|uniref:fimbrial protein n=1 Tax=Franconibacter helveticus TaxID=357240 RepID=UPI00066B46A6|nr:fimbrial protein [Franconibacter helveticus]MDU6925537.1 fimbrial protein [Franconibacter helveticus]